MSKNQKIDRYQWMLEQPFFRQTTGMGEGVWYSKVSSVGYFSWDIMHNV
jgi:hypothetical protein